MVIENIPSVLQSISYEINFDFSLNSIAGLDPNGLFNNRLMNPHHRLHPSDCDVVQVIYTQKFLGGYVDDLGTINIIANGGTIQPGCGNFDFACGHRSAYQYFNAILQNCRFNITKRVISTNEMQTGSITDFLDVHRLLEPGLYDMSTADTYPKCLQKSNFLNNSLSFFG